MNPRVRYGLSAILAIAVNAVWAVPADIAQTPLSITQTVRPMVLLAMSRDHQLYRKAYNDYSDLDGDAAIETTYKNSYAYYGYFDPDKCYEYSVSGYFNPVGAAQAHQCNKSGQTSGTWSGNLLNWASMTRMDILRRVLYGGYRSTDSLTQTILQRALLPTDAHAFAKVFSPGSAANMALYTPYSSDTTITFCNVTWATNGESQSLSVTDATNQPLIRVAKGSYPMWASGEVVECPWSGDYNNGTAPAKTTGNVDLNARVAVCVTGLLEENCRDYKDDSNVVRNKPGGLLQKYGENGSLRFGLMTGSYNKSKSGGVLRRPIGLVAGNTAVNAALNEINLKTGQFTGNPGIISTINAFRINKYSYASHNYQDNCSSPGTLSFANGSCTNWGNPIAEIYAESLRYFAGKAAPYATYNADDHSYFSTLTQINTWIDPMPATDWCAKCNIIFLSTGVNSFDRDEIPGDLTGLDLTAATHLIGSQEGIGTNLIVGGATGQCTAKTVSGLEGAQGVCPEGPTLEGGYGVAGLAHFAHTTGLRRVSDHLQKVNTQTVALARDLPRFQIAVGNNTVTLLPHMEANSTGAAVQATTGWRAGNLLDLTVENLVKDQSDRLVGGSLLITWEDSTWGSDYDMDGVQRIKFCVGSSACNQSCTACINCNNTCATCTAAYNTCTTAYSACNSEYNACNTARTACTSACTTACESTRTSCRSACGNSNSCKTNCDNARTTCRNACPTTCATQYPCTTCTNTCTACTSQCACTSVCPSECSQTVGDNDLQITTSVQQASAGHALLFGYTVAGTVGGTTPTNSACDGAYHGDGVYREIVRTGGRNFSMLTTPQDTPANKPNDCTRKFTAGATTARLLEHPLWYAAKYGGFTDANGNALPDRSAEWDSNSDGVPDRFFYADNPAELGASLERFLEIIATISSSASVAANSITLNQDTRIFQGRYDSADWSGDLVSLPINAVDGSLISMNWSGRAQIDSQARSGQRRIITTNEDTGSGVPFQWGNTTSSDGDGIADKQKQALSGNCGAACTAAQLTDGALRLNYLRGSDAAEVANGGTLRDRTHIMGDVVNSNPVFVGEPLFFYPDSLAPEYYRSFASANAGRHDMIYVGANDGMLHGFNALTGSEVFAYVPRALYPKLSALSNIVYHDYHQSYVDSGPNQGDAYLNLSGDAQWRTLLVGGLGAGGRGIYAIDITNPADFLSSEAAAAGQVKWDISGGDTGFANLGYTYSRPEVARMPDNTFGGVWTVVFGNGYESPTGRASLYVVNAETGVLLSEVVVDNGPNNGLSSVTPVDLNQDGIADYFYAGDLKGNLWRFEPSGNLGVQASFLGHPLFNDAVSIGGTASPITVRPEVIKHPSRGVMVLFGTGAYYRTADRIPNTAAINAFYGIWDRLDGTSDIGRGHLLKQQILATAAVGAYDVRVVSDQPISWHVGAGKPTGTPPANQLGWYLELRQPLDGSAQGEVQVNDPTAHGDRIIFTTLIPKDPTTATCDFGGEGWLTELNPLTGGRITEVVFDLNSDTVFNVADMVTIRINGVDTKVAPSAKKSTVGIIQQPAIIGAGTKEYKYASGAREAGIEITVESPPPPGGGRRGWLQLH